MRIGFVWILAFLGALLNAQPQGRLPYRTLGLDAGLTTNMVYDMRQDGRGVMHVGTEDGVFCHDGQRFRRIELPVARQRCFALVREANGHLLAAVENQVFRLVDGMAQGPICSAPPGAVIAYLALDRQGTLWGTQWGALLRDNGKGHMEPVALPVPQSAFALNNSRGDEGILVTTHTAIWTRRHQTWERVPVPPLAPNERYLTLVEDGSGWKWLLTNHQLYAAPPSGSWRQMTLPIPRAPYPGRDLSSDDQGHVWLPTAQGPLRLWEGKLDLILMPGLEARFSHTDREGNHWIACVEGVVQTLGRGRWRLHDPSTGFPGHGVYSARRDGEGRLWAITSRGLAVADPSGWRIHHQGDFRFLLEGPEGRLVAFGRPVDYFYLTPTRWSPGISLPLPPSLQNQATRFLAVDPQGRFLCQGVQGDALLGEGKGGQLRWSLLPTFGDPTSNRLTFHRLATGTVLASKGTHLAVWSPQGTWIPLPEPLPAEPRGCALDAEGKLIVFYAEQGLITLHPKQGAGWGSGQPHHLKFPDTPPIMGTLCQAPQGVIWLGTSAGILRWDGNPASPPQWEGRGEGISAAEQLPYTLWADAQALWIASSRGLNRLDSQPTSQASLPAPHPLNLGTFHAPGTSAPLRLSWRQPSLRASLALPSYAFPSGLSLEYKLEGGTSTWSPIRATDLELPSLRSGKYTLRVRGHLVGQQTGPEWRLNFQVEPPWWERGWVQALGLLGLAWVAFGLFRWRIARLRAQNEKLEREVLARTQEIRTASEAKSAFLAGMSHELRTPLNAVILYSELIQEDAKSVGNQSLAEDATRIRSAGRHLLNLIDHVLDLSKIEASRLTLKQEPVQLSDLLREVDDTLRPLAIQRGNALVIAYPEDCPAFLGDSIRLRQVLLNLGANATKFTHRGRITVRASRDQLGLLLEVEDTGQGMTQQELQRIFEPFQQATDQTWIQHGGTGLGLALSRKFMELMGGSLEALSNPGQGSCFRARLPKVTWLEGAPQATEG